MDAAESPMVVREYAARLVDQVRGALAVELGFDSETLPVLDHYLRQTQGATAETVGLIAALAGAYFGEVIRAHIGGRWDDVQDDAAPAGWRVVMPTGLRVAPVRLAVAAIVRHDDADGISALDAPTGQQIYVEEALARMGRLTEDDYFSLSGQLDTLEHLHEVLVAIAADKLAAQAAAAPTTDLDPDPDPAGEGEPDPVAN